MRLVADIGGTNTRLALARDGSVLPDTIKSQPNAEAGSFEVAVEQYLSALDTGRPEALVVAVAGPVRGDRAKLTNGSWRFNAGALARRFGFDHVHLLNDLTALGHSVPRLRPGQVDEIAPGEATNEQAVVVGLGTGCNASPVRLSGRRAHSIDVEFGHMTMPGAVSTALATHALDPADFPTVEELFSGRGFARFREAFAGDEPSATDAYAELIGWLLRDVLLIYLPLGGIYVSGGVGRAALGTAAQECARIYGQPLSLHDLTQPPVRLITDDAAALTGCAGYRVA